jgi:hypothetical protein
MRRKSPKIIWLQVDQGEDTTWCEDKINDSDVKYIRVDKPKK